MKLVPISPDDYIATVLPQSAVLWAKGRTLERYASDFTAVSTSAYGKRRFRTLGLSCDGELVSSLKRYERELHCGERTLRCAGIGAVFTPAAQRGRGYATAMLGAFLDAERASGTDLAFLFSDIHPVFYERLGFIALPSRIISLRTASLPARNISSHTLEARDWTGVRRCFDRGDAARPFGLKRTPLVWDWLRLHMEAPEEPAVQHVQLVVRRGRSIAAYVFGRRAPRSDTFLLDEFAAGDDEARDLILPLIRNAAGDLAKVGGPLPPSGARELLPAGAVRRAKSGVTMFAPLSRAARAAWNLQRESIERARGDAVWANDRV